MIQTHKGTVIRATKRKLYEAKESYSSTGAYVGYYYELVANEKLWSGELESPVLTSGESFYIASIGEAVQIDKVIRSSDNTLIYYTYDKNIEDELSDASRQKAEASQVKLDAEIKSIQRKKGDFLDNSMNDLKEQMKAQMTEMEENLKNMTAVVAIAKKVMYANDSQEAMAIIEELNKPKG